MKRLNFKVTGLNWAVTKITDCEVAATFPDEGAVNLIHVIISESMTGYTPDDITVGRVVV